MWTVLARADWPNIHSTRTIMSFLLATIPLGFLVAFVVGRVFRSAQIKGVLAAMLMCSALWLAYGLFATAFDCPNASMGGRSEN